MAIRFKNSAPVILVQAAETLPGNPDKPETCAEHVFNPQTKACVICLNPMADHPMADGKLASAPEQPPAQSLMAALSAKSQPPWEAPAGYTILHALKEHFERSQKGEVLQLIALKNAGTSWVVRSYSPETGRAVLEGQNNMVIRPVIGEREVPLYTAFWR